MIEPRAEIKKIRMGDRRCAARVWNSILTWNHGLILQWYIEYIAVVEWITVWSSLLVHVVLSGHQRALCRSPSQQKCFVDDKRQKDHECSRSVCIKTRLCP